ncbi:MAG: histidine kinase [Anaerolineaceae bacterium]
MFRFPKGLRGKLTLSYTLVTVLGFLLAEVVLMVGYLLVYNYGRLNERDYLHDIIYTLGPQADDYFENGRIDQPGLQAWLDSLATEGYASLPPSDSWDSEAAKIVESKNMVVLSPDGLILAVAQDQSSLKVGEAYTSTEGSNEEQIIERAHEEPMPSPLSLTLVNDQNQIRLAMPIPPTAEGDALNAILLLTVNSPQAKNLGDLLPFTSWLPFTAILLLFAVAPFGTLFGSIAAGGFTKRLKRLSQSADSWAEGNFEDQPIDPSGDEIGALTRKLRSMAERIQTLMQGQQQFATLEERNRLARELHDTIKQQNFATLMQVRAAQNLITTDPAAAQANLQEAERLIKTSQEELGVLINELRPAELEGVGLADALRKFCSEWSEHNKIPVSVQVSNKQNIGLDHEQALYRVAQESFSNIARHSQASQAQLVLEYAPNAVTMRISDNGIGFDSQKQAQSGYGLRNMQERIEQIAGRFEISSKPDGGTEIRVIIPRPPVVEEMS